MFNKYGMAEDTIMSTAKNTIDNNQRYNENKRILYLPKYESLNKAIIGLAIIKIPHGMKRYKGE